MYRRLIPAATLALLVAGCSTTPTTYNPNDSYALNAARAAGISAKLEDKALPKDTVTSITDSAGFGFAMAASGYNAPLPGFSGSQMAGMNFAAWLLVPEADSARNSMFAWMPAAEAGNAPIDHLADLLIEAASKAAEDMGYTPKPSIAKSGTDKSGVGVYLRDGNREVCSNKGEYSTCWIGFALREPEKKIPPDFIGSSGETLFFDPSNNVYSRFVFLKDNQGLNELELLVNTSKHLPAWVYFYVAPKKVFIGKDQPIKIPLIINQGKVHYFIKPQQEG